MEGKKKLYIVSFGDSPKYRMEYDVPAGTDALHKPSPFIRIEKTLNDFLRERFPDETFAYYTSPRVTEVEWSHRDRYLSYPPLDHAALEEIEKVLVKGVEDMKFTQHLDTDAPYNAVPPAC